MSDLERGCLARYVDLLRERLGERLVSVTLFGSAARGDMWAASSPMHSDIDILVIVGTALSEGERAQLIDCTYPLYLECGRQISPQFLDDAQLREPNERRRRFLADVERDGVRL